MNSLVLLLPAPTCIEHLPPELLTMILESLCSDSRTPGIMLPPPRPGHDVVSFSQVSPRWRTIANNNPYLWTKYNLDLKPQWTRRRFDSLLHALDRFISRARGQDLDFTVSQLSPEFTQDIFLGILRTHAPRMRSLKMVVSYASARAFGIAPAMPFERLGTLSIRMLPQETSSGRGPVRSQTRVLTAIPMLPELEIGYSLWLPAHPPRLRLLEWDPPLHQLTKFNAPNVYMEMTAWVRVFEHCPLLAECTLACDVAGDSDFVAEPATPFVLQHLRVLHLDFRLVEGVVWGYITTPTLTDLRITSLSDHDLHLWDQARFMAFKHRSGYTLTRLALQFDFSDLVAGVIEILETSPELEHLELRWTGLFRIPFSLSPVMKRLSGQGGRSLLLPALRTIGLDATHRSLRMLRKRCTRDAEGSLSEIILYVHEPLGGLPPFADEIAALRETGVVVALKPMDFYGALDLRAFYDEEDAGNAPDPLQMWEDMMQADEEEDAEMAQAEEEGSEGYEDSRMDEGYGTDGDIDRQD
ncbi:hypothetical protein FB451DRAFT_1561135 [Mycena latifolia]|nr:hypothetical protein FB451DRAFT_1561135 [Mycena latifolia]